MPRLVLVRHSRVSLEAVRPNSDWPLSPEGRDLCAPLAEALRDYELDVLVSSNELRARETAELVAGHLDIEWRTAEGLHEHVRPVVASELYEPSMQRFFASPAERVFGDESAEEAYDRFAAAVETVLREEQGRNVAVVSHGTVLALYAAPYFGVGAAALWDRLGHPSFLVVDTDSKTPLRIVENLEEDEADEDAAVDDDGDEAAEAGDAYNEEGGSQ